jgi:hypothetical protein
VYRLARLLFGFIQEPLIIPYSSFRGQILGGVAGIHLAFKRLIPQTITHQGIRASDPRDHGRIGGHHR